MQLYQHRKTFFYGGLICITTVITVLLVVQMFLFDEQGDSLHLHQWSFIAVEGIVNSDFLF